MKNSLREMQLCGILPCLLPEEPLALARRMQALGSAGFPCVELDFSFEAEDSAPWELLGEAETVALGAAVQTVRQARHALDAGAAWVSLPGTQPEALQALSIPEEALLVRCSPKEVQPILHAHPRARLVVTGAAGAGQEAALLQNPQVTALGETVRFTADSDVEPVEALHCRWAESLGFSLAHVGINGADAQEAQETALRFSRLLGMPYVSGEASDYAGSLIEAMKAQGRGKNGHIGIATASLPRALYYAQQAGFSFDPASRKDDPSGRAILYYLDQEIAGFAVHFLQR